MPSRPQQANVKRNASMAGGIENPWKYQVSKGFCFYTKSQIEVSLLFFIDFNQTIVTEN
jgi:hypothetical protein